MGYSTLYRPRDAAATPLYRAVLDCLKTYLAERQGDRSDPAHPCAESALRHFLQCGIPRFGVARFRCGKCGESRFVPFSCKRRLACVSCDSKRAVMMGATIGVCCERTWAQISEGAKLMRASMGVIFIENLLL